MTNQEQAYINGFVKRAAERGVSEEAARAILLDKLQNQKASVPLNALFSGGSGLYHGARDMMAPEETPSRLLNITLPSIGGNILGALPGILAKNPGLSMAGSQMAGMAGGGFGAKHYNDKLQEAIAKVKAEQGGGQ